MEQLDLFTIEKRTSDIKTIPIHINQKVTVVILSPKEYKQSEDYYYLKEFEKFTGTISQIIYKPTIQYIVEFPNKTGYFYHDELLILEEE
jgi:hypothetical protein